MYHSNKFTNYLCLLLVCSTIPQVTIMTMERNFDEEDQLQQAVEASKLTYEQEAYQDMLFELTLQEQAKIAEETENDAALAKALQEEEGGILQERRTTGKSEQPPLQQKAEQRTSNLTSEAPPLPLKNRFNKPLPTIQQKCLICFDEKNATEFSTLQCKHSFCKGCLDTHINNALKEQNTNGLVCPEPKCKSLLQETDIRAINPAKVTAFADIATKAALANNGNFKHCPTPNCPMVFEVDQQTKHRVTCPACKKNYCSQCQLDHNPGQMSCEEARLASNKPAAEKASENLIRTATKPCPKCNSRIEKNDGCLHMTCLKCRHQFCWKCLGIWSQHRDNYNCNNKETNPVTAPTAHSNNPNHARAIAHNFPQGFAIRTMAPLATDNLAYIAHEQILPPTYHGGYQAQFTIQFRRRLSDHNFRDFLRIIHGLIPAAMITSLTPNTSNSTQQSITIQTPWNREQMNNIIAQANARLSLHVTTGYIN